MRIIDNLFNLKSDLAEIPQLETSDTDSVSSTPEPEDFPELTRMNRDLDIQNQKLAVILAGPAMQKVFGPKSQS